MRFVEILNNKKDLVGAFFRNFSIKYFAKSYQIITSSLNCSCHNNGSVKNCALHNSG